VAVNAPGAYGSWASALNGNPNRIWLSLVLLALTHQKARAVMVTIMTTARVAGDALKLVLSCG